MRVYKRVAAASEAGEVAALRTELEDRYGVLPDAATNLLHVAVLRLKGWRAGVERIRVRAGRADVDLRAGLVLKRPEIEFIVGHTPNKLAFDVAGAFRITQHLRPADRLAQVEKLLDALSEARAEVPAQR